MVFISSVFMTDFYLFACEWCQLHFIYLKMNADFPKQPGKKANGFLRPRSQKWYPFCLCLMSSIALFLYLNWLHRYDHLYICMFLEKNSSLGVNFCLTWICIHWVFGRKVNSWLQTNKKCDWKFIFNTLIAVFITKVVLIFLNYAKNLKGQNYHHPVLYTFHIPFLFIIYNKWCSQVFMLGIVRHVENLKPIIHHTVLK